MLAVNVCLLPLPLAYLVGLGDSEGIDLWQTATEPSWLAFFVRPPFVPWPAAALAVASALAVWLCSERRYLGVILSVSLAWLGIVIMSLTRGAPPLLVLHPIVIFVLIWRSRHAFA